MGPVSATAEWKRSTKMTVREEKNDHGSKQRQTQNAGSVHREDPGVERRILLSLGIF